jgi:hypothetical protein
MNFNDLKRFIEKSMRMSHIYQPVMLMTLLEKGGRASVRDIGISILIHDEGQIEYYEQITKETVRNAKRLGTGAELARVGCCCLLTVGLLHADRGYRSERFSRTLHDVRSRLSPHEVVTEKHYVG